jgi:Asp-tRNA(Asn)/Glu-tRNA(Gln) amidotransferase A subunit family amidase
MQLFPAADQTIVGLSKLVQSGQRSCVEIVEGCLANIDAREGDVRAWVHVDREGALSTAAQRDAQIAAGQTCGSLHGIPIGIKDIVDVAGFPTGAGSELLSRQVVDIDATLVRRLRDAGAIILGKTVTTQFACYDPPVTRNPWNIDHTPGGSSSGSAASVAAGMCLGGIGSQTGGSITRPASFCGVAGCKPTFGRVSCRGVVPLATSLDHPGPIARCISDLSILYDVLAGFDPSDVNSVDRSVESAAAAIAAQTVTAPRIARVRGFFDDLAEPDMRAAIDSVVDQFAQSGANVTDAPLSECFNGVLEHHICLMRAETAAYHEQRIAEHPEDYQPGIQTLIEAGLAVSVTDYVRARQHQQQLKREILSAFAEADVLVCPAALGPAPDPSTTGDPSFNAPWSHSGLPTVTFPVGLSQDGMPLGIQIVGKHYGEASLFAVAAWCENVVRKSL